MLASLLLLAAFTAVHGSVYVSYVPGTLPLVITAPHGGSKNPSSFPERSIDTNALNSKKYCGYLGSDGSCRYDHTHNAAGACTARTYRECKVPYLKDSYTKTIATSVAKEIERLTGSKPHLVTMELQRNKIDANREVDEATFGASNTIDVYNEYARKINQAKAAVGGGGLLLDIHGQSHSHGMVELGYTVYGSRLDCGLPCFTREDTSIRRLVERRCGLASNTGCFEWILSGGQSLGHFLAQEGYTVVPSPQHPGPNGASYYSGGYTTKTYGSKNGGSIDAIQIEIPRHERFDSAARRDFIKSLATAVVGFMRAHYGHLMT